MRTRHPESHAMKPTEVPRFVYRFNSLTVEQKTVMLKLFKEGSGRELHTVHDHKDLKKCWIRPSAIIIVENGELSHQNLEDGEYALMAEATVIRLNTTHKQGFVSMLSSGQNNLVPFVMTKDEFDVVQSVWLPKSKHSSAHAVVESHQP